MARWLFDGLYTKWQMHSVRDNFLQSSMHFSILQKCFNSLRLCFVISVLLEMYQGTLIGTKYDAWKFS